jgi:hypothetical protein
MSPDNEISPRRAASVPWGVGADWAAAASVLALWLLTRPYRGVRHDAILYLGQTLLRLMPDRFGSDLFLRAGGAQDKYSLFSPLMAPIVEHFGIGRPELVLLVACHVLFMLACWKLTEGWFERPLRWAAMMFIAVLPHTYGGLGEFSYAEPFLTARSFAEPLALLALWQLLRGRLPVALALAVMATLFHPLVTLPILVVGWLLLVRRHRAWAWLGLLVPAAVALGGMGIAPFDGLWRVYDPAWLSAIRQPNAQVFIAAQTRLDWAPVAFDALVLALLLRSDRAPVVMRQLAQVILAAAAVLTVTWGVGVDVFHNVLLTQLQLWRIYWPMHLLATIALPLVALGYWRRGWVGRWCAAAVGVAGIAVMSNWATGWVCLLWPLAALAAGHWKAQVADSTAKAAVAASFLAMAGISAKVASFTIFAVLSLPDNFDGASPLLIVLGLPFVGVLLAAAVLWLLTDRARWRPVAWIVIAIGIAFGTRMWDQRSSWQRRLEAGMESGPPVFDAQMPPTASVYWDIDLVTPWLLSLRGNFFSYNQGAGLLFDRATALEFVHRSDLLEGVSVQRELCTTIQGLTARPGAPKAVCTPTVEVATELCRTARNLDYMVFAGPLPMPAIAEWHDNPVPAGADRKSYYLYSCAPLR